MTYGKIPDFSRDTLTTMLKGKCCHVTNLGFALDNEYHDKDETPS